MFRILSTVAFSLLIAGAAWAGGACDEHQKAASASTSAGHCGAEKASVKMASSGAGCTAAEKAACEAKMAAHGANAADCPYCGFVDALKANHGKVTMTTVESEKGVMVVFAANSKDDVQAAQAVANKAYAMMAGTSSHCAVTKAKTASMAQNCDGCKNGLEAFANTEVDFKTTNQGATAKVKVSDKAQLEKLHAFFEGLKPADAKVEG
jgi:hypothetical protein